METKNNSEFMSQVDAFSEEMQKFIEKSDNRHALIIIASEPDEKRGKLTSNRVYHGK